MNRDAAIFRTVPWPGSPFLKLEHEGAVRLLLGELIPGTGCEGPPAWSMGRQGEPVQGETSEVVTVGDNQLSIPWDHLMNEEGFSESPRRGMKRICMSMGPGGIWHRTFLDGVSMCVKQASSGTREASK